MKLLLKKKMNVVFGFLTLISMHVIGQDFAGLVNPFIGASTSVGDAGIYHGLGKTFPGATTPFGMVQVSPNTITGGDNGSGYSYEHTSIEGFAFTQMSGIGWFGDLGNFLVMPATGVLKTFSGTLENPAGGYRSKYDKSSEKASAGYYTVKLIDYNIKAEMTAAPHSGMLRFTFPENDLSRIQIDLARRVGGTSVMQYVKVVDNYTIQGWMKCTPDGGGWGNGEGKANYTVYFYAQFDKPLQNYGVWSADIPDSWTRKREDIESQKYHERVAAAQVFKDVKEMEGKHLGFFTEFATKANEAVQMRVGISFTGIDGAKKNLQSEITHWNFDALRKQAYNSWNNALAKVKVQGGTKDEQIVFYSALYHTMIDPRIYSDVTGDYVGGDYKVHKKEGFTKRTIFSGWDVFRSQMPLQTIINPGVVNDMLNSLITMADQSGKEYYERWEFLNAYTGCMIGNPAVSVLLDAYAKGIRNYNVPKAYRFAVNSVEKFGNGERGYTPASTLGISNTLEYAYFDWCVGRMATLLNKKQDADKYLKRSQNYKNIFDIEKKWFRPRNEDGTWEAWPAEGRLKQWYGSIECNPYQQGWFVPHDIEGMVKLMGDRKSVTADLVSFFEHTPKNMMWNDYYNHANEPVHHVPFIFNRIGSPYLTQKWSRIVCESAYNNSVEGLVGNEDVGQMSAWYILAASGLHPVCPGDNRYEITSPVFSKINFALDSKYYKGNSFTIIAKNNSSKNIYIKSAKLNGEAYNKCYIMHSDIAAGGVLELEMSATPNVNWGRQ